MNIVANFEHRASSSRGKHEGESSFALCDRLGRTRDNSQRQLPTDHDYAVPTREYQTDQSSLKLLRLLLALSSRKRERQLQKHLHRFRRVDTVTPYQGNALIDLGLHIPNGISNEKRASRKLTPLPRCRIYYLEESMRPFSLPDHVLCERLDRRRPMELLCSRITEVDPARVEALHHFDIEPRPISWRTHRFQNVLPGSLG